MTVGSSSGNPAERLAFSVEGACRALPMSRESLYRLIRSGQIRTFKLGRRRYVTKQALLDFIASRETVEAEQRKLA